jgi:CRP/FNR family transcriptional regulator, anaerobic regulatory protein
MLGQVTKPSASFTRQVLPAGDRRAKIRRDKARRRLQSRIGERAVALFEASGRRRPFRGGEVLARCDEAGKDVYFVLDGVVGLYHDLPSGDIGVLGYCSCGDLIAPARLGETWGFDAKSLTRGMLLELSLQDVRLSNAGKRDLVWPLFEACCTELVHRTMRLRSYWFLTVKARLATFLFEMNDAIGERTERGLVVHLPMFRDEIANYTGARTETVCRILTGWKDRGLIIMNSPRVLVIPNSDLLRADAFDQPPESP